MAPDDLFHQVKEMLDSWKKEALDLEKRIQEQTLTEGAIYDFTK
ncbi:hypothetical protein EP7_002271 [Isosphaeraceae bacterium EP7]